MFIECFMWQVLCLLLQHLNEKDDSFNPFTDDETEKLIYLTINYKASECWSWELTSALRNPAVSYLK